jgi:GNAT superfamily N-acetyltransferase
MTGSGLSSASTVTAPWLVPPSGFGAAESSFPARTGVPAEQVRGVYYATRLMVAPEYRGQGLSALLIYALFREARILDCGKVIALMGEDDAVAAGITRAEPMRGVPPLRYTGHQGTRASCRSGGR